MRCVRVVAVAVSLITTAAAIAASGTSHDEKLEEFTQTIDAFSARIETAAEASQKSGDSGLAQQQFLIQDMLRRSTAEIRFLQHAAMSNPIRLLTATQVRKIDDLADLIAEIDYADKMKMAPVIAATQSRVDAVLDAMAEGKNYPILFGMLSRDLMDKPESARADIEIFGHNIVDPLLRKNPTIRVGGAEVPPNFVTVTGESVLVTIPDGAKDHVGFSPTPCQPRTAFSVRATAFYGDPHGVWPIRWVSELESSSDFTALPSSKVYELSVSYNLERPENTPSTETFSNRSDYVVAACGQTVEAAVKFEAPPGARDLSCQVSWADTAGSKTSTKTCGVKGSRVEAHGALTGPDQICSPDKVCGCIVNARGWLQIDGSFKKDNITVLTRTASLPKKYAILANDTTTVPLEIEAGAKLKHIGVLINRRSCPTIHGRLDLQFSDDGRQITAGVSRQGGFRASYDNDVLTVINATTESADVSDTSN